MNGIFDYTNTKAALVVTVLFLFVIARQKIQSKKESQQTAMHLQNGTDQVLQKSYLDKDVYDLHLGVLVGIVLILVFPFLPAIEGLLHAEESRFNVLVFIWVLLVNIFLGVIYSVQRKPKDRN